VEEKMKIAVIGGGSTYTPELLEGIVQRQEVLRVSEVVLEDIDSKRLSSVFGFSKRMLGHLGARFAFRMTMDLEDAIKGATFVVIQIRVGGQEARHRDEERGKRLGIVGQETTGEGGFAKAMRTIPVVLGIASKVKELAEGAWILNFTNPSGIVTEALLRFGGVRTVGLCNVPMDMHMEAAKALGVAPERLELDYFGLNHLGFVRGIKVDGVDVTRDVLALLSSERGPANLPEIEYDRAFISALGMIPSPYLRYYYATEKVLEEQAKSAKTRAMEVMEIERELFAYYDDESNFEKPEALNKRGGAWYSRVAVRVMEGLLSPSGRKEVINTLNKGAINGLPEDAVVEIPAHISAYGVVPEKVGDVPEEVFGLIRQVKAYERLTIEASMTRSYEKALIALVNNPLVRTVEKAKAVLEDMIKSGDFVPVT
jgi:6-phospho-beta-glucosidase